MSAVVLQLPASAQRKAKRRISRVQVQAEDRWLSKNHDKWETKETHELEHAECLPPRARQLMQLLDKEWGKIPQPTVAAMRQRIFEMRQIIEKRNRVKAWMQTLGADLDAITTPEQALFYVFDRLA